MTNTLFTSRDHRDRWHNQVGQVPDLPSGDLFETVDVRL